MSAGGAARSQSPCGPRGWWRSPRASPACPRPGAAAPVGPESSVCGQFPPRWDVNQGQTCLPTSTRLRLGFQRGICSSSSNSSRCSHPTGAARTASTRNTLPSPGSTALDTAAPASCGAQRHVKPSPPNAPELLWHVKEMGSGALPAQPLPASLGGAAGCSALAAGLFLLGGCRRDLCRRTGGCRCLLRALCTWL